MILKSLLTTGLLFAITLTAQSQVAGTPPFAFFSGAGGSGDLTAVCADAGGTLVDNTCTFSGNGNYTLDLSKQTQDITVTVIGAGGGMGTLDHDKWNAYGGAGGGAAISTVTLSAGTYNITLGRGGNSASRWINGYRAGNGGSSSISGPGVNMSATGGQGGLQSGYKPRKGRGRRTGLPATGGIGTGGSQNCRGGQGRNANYTRGTGRAGACNGGAGGKGSSGGGASEFGGAGRSGVCGAGAGAHGRRGADGCVVFKW